MGGCPFRLNELPQYDTIGCRASRRSLGDGMTFCLGITVEDGLVGIADTRVLSGSESLVAKKIATYQGPGFSFFVMTSGLRSLRDKVLLHFEEVLRQTAARD